MTTEPGAARVPLRLPPPRSPGLYRLDLVCLGNICRSPMAEAVLRADLHDAGLGPRVTLTSAGTGDWHVGNPIDRRAAATLTAHGYDASAHRAQQFDPARFAASDAVLAMDEDNLADLDKLRQAVEDPDQAPRLLLFRDLDPLAKGADRDVPDPYYGGDDGFDRVLTILRRTSRVIVAELGEHLR